MITTLLDLLVPARCAACGTRGMPCCPRCHEVWGALRRVHRLPVEGTPLYALARYHGVARKLLIEYKERGRRDLAPALGRALADALRVLPGIRAPLCLVPAPSRAPIARVRGGPHVHRLAEIAAHLLATRGFLATSAQCLALTRGTRDAVGLTGPQRQANLAGHLRFRPSVRPPPDAQVILLDDVITTGATAAACLRELAVQGAPAVAVLALLAAG